MMLMPEDENLGIKDTSGLTDADWAVINKLMRAHRDGGKKALQREMKTLIEQDMVRYVTIMHAFFPRRTSEMIRDVAAEHGVTEEEAREMAEKMNSPSTKRH
jgi:hypothetical protein